MDRDFAQVMGGAQAVISAVLPAVFVGFAYFVLTLDRQRANSPSKDDTQAGIKLVLFALMIAGVTMAAGGVEKLLAFVFSGFKGGAGPIKQALPPILVGGAVAAAVALAFLPRTNNTTYRQVERYSLGTLGVYYGIALITGLNGVLSGLFAGAAWGMTAPALATVIVAGAVGLLSVLRLGTISGWTAPVRPQASYPPQGGQGGGGYPPQQGGYGQQGGYPPQGGGYPPQGGGYPPQGGGYPPQGGGYPPQQGGGWQ